MRVLCSCGHRMRPSNFAAAAFSSAVVVFAAAALFLSPAVAQETDVDCTQYQHTYELPFSGGAVIDYVVDDGTLRARLTRQGSGWVGFAVPEDPTCQLCMKGSNAVIGVPGPSSSVLKYDLTAYKADGVLPMEEARQTLVDESIEEMGGKTIVTFTKLLEEEGENSINGDGPNTFLWAMGPEGMTELGYHTLKGKFQLDLSPCGESGAAAPTASAVPPPAPTTDGGSASEPTSSVIEEPEPTASLTEQPTPANNDTSAGFRSKCIHRFFGLLMISSLWVSAFKM